MYKRKRENVVMINIFICNKKSHSRDLQVERNAVIYTEFFFFFFNNTQMNKGM